LRDEQEGAERDEEAENVGGQPGAEGGHPKQPQVQQRIRQRMLSAYESHPDR
jgi:hypothetical protein